MLKVLIGIFTLCLTTGVHGVSVIFQEMGPLGSYSVNEIFLDVPCKVQPCWFPIRKQTNMTASFRSSNTGALDLHSEVYLEISNSRKKIDIAPLMCPKYVCPIQPMEKKSYSVIIKPNFHADPMKALLYWKLYNQKNERLFGIYFPVIIYDPETHQPNSVVID